MDESKKRHRTRHAKVKPSPQSPPDTPSKSADDFSWTRFWKRFPREAAEYHPLSPKDLGYVLFFWESLPCRQAHAADAGDYYDIGMWTFKAMDFIALAARDFGLNAGGFLLAAHIYNHYLPVALAAHPIPREDHCGWSAKDFLAKLDGFTNGPAEQEREDFRQGLAVISEIKQKRLALGLPGPSPQPGAPVASISPINPAQLENRSTPVSKTELARRILNAGNARFQKAKAILEAHDLQPQANKWTIRLDPDLGADVIKRLSDAAP
jgi:hypothetical protein